MIIYHVEAFDENYTKQDYMIQNSFITTNFEHALEMGKKMYEQQNIEIVYLSYWEDERLTMIRIIDEDGKISE